MLYSVKVVRERSQITCQPFRGGGDVKLTRLIKLIKPSLKKWRGGQELKKNYVDFVCERPLCVIYIHNLGAIQ